MENCTFDLNSDQLIYGNIQYVKRGQFICWNMIELEISNKHMTKENLLQIFSSWFNFIHKKCLTECYSHKCLFHLCLGEGIIESQTNLCVFKSPTCYLFIYHKCYYKKISIPDTDFFFFLI